VLIDEDPGAAQTSAPWGKGSGGELSGHGGLPGAVWDGSGASPSRESMNADPAPAGSDRADGGTHPPPGLVTGGGPGRVGCTGRTGPTLRYGPVAIDRAISQGLSLALPDGWSGVRGWAAGDTCWPPETPRERASGLTQPAAQRLLGQFLERAATLPLPEDPDQETGDERARDRSDKGALMGVLNASPAMSTLLLLRDFSPRQVPSGNCLQAIAFR